LTVIVAPQSGSGIPTGEVTFKNAGAILATKILSNGSAKYVTSLLPAGSDAITAAYGGDSNFNASTSAPLNQVVLAVTELSLASSPSPSAYGQPVTFSATVTSSIGPPPDGETVTFEKGSKVLGGGTLSSGLATFLYSTLSVGTDSIKAVYSGDTNFAGSKSPSLSQRVTAASTSTTLTSSLNPSNSGQSVTFTATVAGEFGGNVTGSVTFTDGSKTLKKVSLSGGTAEYTTTTLTVGGHNISATYDGSTDYSGSSASLTQTVNE
jgi:hypothetical protein